MKNRHLIFALASFLVSAIGIAFKFPGDILLAFTGAFIFGRSVANWINEVESK